MGRSSERGASAVEFALLVPFLVVLLLGVIDFGLWLGDAISGRQAVRESARQGVVERFSSPGCDAAAPEMQQLACAAAVRTGAFNGLSRTSAKAYVVDQTGTATSTWRRDYRLVVCTSIKADGITGLTPLPRGGLIRSEVIMRIEQPMDATTLPTRPAGVYGPTTDWSWCDGRSST